MFTEINELPVNTKINRAASLSGLLDKHSNAHFFTTDVVAALEADEELPAIIAYFEGNLEFPNDRQDIKTVESIVRDALKKVYPSFSIEMLNQVIRDF